MKKIMAGLVLVFCAVWMEGNAWAVWLGPAGCSVKQTISGVQDGGTVKAGQKISWSATMFAGKGVWATYTLKGEIALRGGYMQAVLDIRDDKTNKILKSVYCNATKAWGMDFLAPKTSSESWTLAVPNLNPGTYKFVFRIVPWYGQNLNQGGTSAYVPGCDYSLRANVVK